MRGLMKKKRITVQSAKAKGRRLQQWFCQRISDYLGIPWGPDELIASREGCQNGTDVRLIGDALNRFKYSCECKNQENWAVHQWIEQAKTNQIEGTDWLICAKRSRHKPVIIMDVDAFFNLIKQIRDKKNDIGNGIKGNSLPKKTY